MGISVGVNPPKTPVTAGSHGIAKNTIPNVCKMPGPPAPFVPTPLPNIAKSELSPKGYSTTVMIEGSAVAIRGATFESVGDMASKGTGGGLISAITQGPAKFVSPGSMNVKIEGKNVQLLGDLMLNNCGPGGNPNTGGTMSGEQQADQGGENPKKVDCDKGPPSRQGKTPPLSDCEKEELCVKGRSVNRQMRAHQKGTKRGRPLKRITGAAKTKLDKARKARLGQINADARAGAPLKLQGFCAVTEECEKELREMAEKNAYHGFSPDHIQDMGLNGHVTSVKNLRWMSSQMNSWIGSITGENDFHRKYTGLDVSNCCP
jgi:uncharacterized Zn-binding protein involved in type VI secretion